jgi:hypothetical protein
LASSIALRPFCSIPVKQGLEDIDIALIETKLARVIFAARPDHLRRTLIEAAVTEPIPKAGLDAEQNRWRRPTVWVEP